MKKIQSLILIAICLSSINIIAKEKISQSNIQKKTISILACNPSTSSSDLDIGNVRARIWINGDMWWDLTGTAIYEVPKGSGKHSLFSGALWIGGKDGAGNLKIAAQTYRQSGSDFWPGPIDTTNTSISTSQCLFYDKHWKVTRQQVLDFKNGAAPSQAIIDWPGNGNPTYGEALFLAPFYDANGDGTYDYNGGDYPKYDFGTLPPGAMHKLNGDQTIWWVFNDVGDVHMETGSIYPIGIEIRAQAYAYCTNDADLSNTTFYSYEIINRASSILNETYIGQFVDADLGKAFDDFVGCDVGRNLGYCYNGDTLDEGPMGYGSLLPAVGIDILQGPLADILDGIDNDHDSIIDEVGEEITMSKFVYYNNDNSNSGNPSTALHYYNYLDGKWKDNSPLVYGGTGYQTPGAILCNYMFPGSSDPSNFGTYGVDPGLDWSESLPCVGCPPNVPNDRRFIMSSGKFTMLPGSVTHITTAAVWASAPGGIDSSMQALYRADDKIQTFFDNNFTGINTCLMVNDVNELQQIGHSIYPSPAKDYFNFRFNERTKKINLKVFSSNGKLIYKHEFINVDELKVNTYQWSSGIYYYQLRNDSDKNVSGKITILN